MKKTIFRTLERPRSLKLREGEAKSGKIDTWKIYKKNCKSYEGTLLRMRSTVSVGQECVPVISAHGMGSQLQSVNPL